MAMALSVLLGKQRKEIADFENLPRDRFLPWLRRMDVLFAQGVEQDSAFDAYFEVGFGFAQIAKSVRHGAAGGGDPLLGQGDVVG